MRSLTGAGFVILMLGSAILGQMVFSILMLAVVFLGLKEFHELISIKYSSSSRLLTISAGMLFYLSLALNAAGWIDTGILLLDLPVLFLVFIAELWRNKQDPFINIGISISGIFYIALPLGLSLYFFDPVSHSGPSHFGTVIGYLLILWLNDTGAYFTGSLLGKHRLFERISPKKSWEGSIGGAVFALLTAWVLSLFFIDMDLWKWLVMAMIIILTGTLGDLVESMLKRSLGVKDSGSLLPGHGGILDRFDAVFLSVPFVFVFLTLF